MWCHFETVLAAIRLKDLLGVDAQIAERVDRDEHVADVGVDLCILESFLKVVVDASLVTLESRVMSETPACAFLNPSLQSALATPPLEGAPPLEGGGLEATPAFLAPAFLEMAMMEE